MTCNTVNLKCRFCGQDEDINDNFFDYKEKCCGNCWMNGELEIV